MNHDDETFNQLISEARSWKMLGWDFSALKGRWIEENPPWDFRKVIIDEASRSNSLLDLGTGGGEFLSSLIPLPRMTFCTEGYPPNLNVAKIRLKPLEVDVVNSFCDDNNVAIQRGALPFRSESLDLVVDRHESFLANEVYRVLKKGHYFLTQQVGTENLAELNLLLGAKILTPVWNLVECEKQVERAGFEIVQSKEAKLNSEFKDICAIACFLLSAPWQIPGFTIESYLQTLKKLHETIEAKGSVRATGTRFYLKALKK